MKRWVQLAEGDDWGVKYLALPENRLDARGFAQSENAYPLKSGDVLRVRWPDGSVSEEEVLFRREHQEVGDHGKPYDVASDVPHVKVMVRGLAVAVRLDRV